eukprot:TRINITY_DN3274_c0_g1_i1.p1 TRINITY_DN3274_c0_g1~~TRINITY_DN3274_c0_g1_i1.p1  ORF type:complete len:471 (+),score=57.08 TRINITY_DN3274_c0_g1_i1:234-1646(+)
MEVFFLMSIAMTLSSSTSVPDSRISIGDGSSSGTFRKSHALLSFFPILCKNSMSLNHRGDCIQNRATSINANNNNRKKNPFGLNKNILKHILSKRRRKTPLKLKSPPITTTSTERSITSSSANESQITLPQSNSPLKTGSSSYKNSSSASADATQDFIVDLIKSTNLIANILQEDSKAYEINNASTNEGVQLASNSSEIIALFSPTPDVSEDPITPVPQNAPLYTTPSPNLSSTLQSSSTELNKSLLKNETLDNVTPFKPMNIREEDFNEDSRPFMTDYNPINETSFLNITSSLIQEIKNITHVFTHESSSTVSPNSFSLDSPPSNVTTIDDPPVEVNNDKSEDLQKQRVRTQTKEELSESFKDDDDSSLPSLLLSIINHDTKTRDPLEYSPLKYGKYTHPPNSFHSHPFYFLPSSESKSLSEPPGSFIVQRMSSLPDKTYERRRLAPLLPIKYKPRFPSLNLSDFFYIL